jgi:histidine triad (HIT) family protein
MNEPDFCVFCRIVAETEPATIVRRWADVIAIVPLKPVTDGHILVLPTDHVRDATVLPEVTAMVMRRASQLAYPPCNIITSAGEEATQTVPHLHIHVVPRRRGDGLALPWTKPSIVTSTLAIHNTSPNDSRAAGFVAGLQIGFDEGRRHGR